MIQITELNNIFVTADHHFGHKNIIGYCERPFKTVEEMDETLIENWNNMVKPGDIIYHLGDFTLGGFDTARSYFRRLNGQIYVLANPWHHDRYWLPKNGYGRLGRRHFGPYQESDHPALMQSKIEKDLAHITIVPPMVVLEIAGMGDEGRNLAVTLCHYPLQVWDRKHYGAWALGGHTHKPYETEDFILNVGIDCMNYRPVNLGDVLEMMRGKGWAGAIAC